jgi:hypothetical protein
MKYIDADLQLVIKSFKAGAEWQKEQMLKDTDYNKLDKEIATWIPAHISGGDDEVWRDIKKAVTEWAGIVARHFYEFGRGIK